MTASNIKDSINKGLMVCQKEKIIEGDNVINACCLFDVDSLKCSNYLKVKYGKNIEYKNGFIKNDKGEENKYRTNIDYMIKEKKINIELILIIYLMEKIKYQLKIVS